MVECSKCGEWFYRMCEQMADGIFMKRKCANPEKWSNTLKQIVCNLPTICLSVFDHFMNLVFKELS